MPFSMLKNCGCGSGNLLNECPYRATNGFFVLLSFAPVGWTVKQNCIQQHTRKVAIKFQKRFVASARKVPKCTRDALMR